MKYSVMIRVDMVRLAPDTLTRWKVGQKVYVLRRRHRSAPFFIFIIMEGL